MLLPDRFEDLPKLVDDILQTSVSTGPRGALRMVQGIQAFIGVGGEWLKDTGGASAQESSSTWCRRRPLEPSSLLETDRELPFQWRQAVNKNDQTERIRRI
ncbi:hypothetical protein DVH24_038910 [Malus domestica]|uniref:Uncharacterized protein n=1 Tax=Malus domestica TaxID=3750 RepID=A0A498KBB5_MALDO|nr:hypothetical protein DVH24_038910 [Malus domestica]